MIIDSHVHINKVDDTVGLIRSASLNEIDVLLICSLGVGGYTQHPTAEEVAAANDCVLEAIKHFPDEVRGICYATPQHPEESLAEIDRCIANGPMLGIKLWVAAKASDPSVEPIARKAVELDVPILQHAWDKATGNMELHLSRALEQRRIFPSIEMQKSGTRQEQLLLPEKTYSKVVTMRRMLEVLGSDERTEVILERLKKTKNNEEFLDSLNKG